MTTVRASAALALAMSAGGALAWDVVEPKEAQPWEKTAASEMREYVTKRVSGSLSVAGVEVERFHVGDTDLAKAKGLASSDLKDEEWVVKSFGGDVVVNGGGTRGCLYAAYHFLEDALGVRFWSETEEDVPAASPVELAVLDMRGRPVFRYRDIFRSKDPEKSQSKFAIRRRLNRNGDVPVPMSLGGAFDYGPPSHCHTFNHYIPWRRHGEKEPELFSLVDGKRCGGQDFAKGGQLCLANPDVFRRIVRGVLDNLEKSAAKAKAEGRAAPRLFDVSMNDNKRRCQCERCRAEEEKYGATGLYLNFCNAVADEVKKVRPDAFVTTLAYYYTEDLPLGGVKPRENLLVKLCNTRQNMASSILSDDDNEIFRGLVRGWSGLTSHLFVWDYAITYTKETNGFPFPNEWHYGDKFAYYATNGVEGVFLEHERQDTADFFDIKYYMETKLFENPFQSAPKLLEAACREYFGEKAGAHVYASRRRLAEAQAKRQNTRLSWFPQFNQFNFIRREDIAFMRREYDLAAVAANGDEHALRRLARARAGLERLHERRDGIAVRFDRGGQRGWEFPVEKITLCGKDVSDALVEDPETGGKAIRIDADSKALGMPFAFGFYNARTRKTVVSSRISKPKVGGEYYWHDIGRVTAPENGYLYMTRKWVVQVHLPNPDFEGHTYALKARVKFTGPAFDSRSAATNNFIWIDRVVFEDAEPVADATPSEKAAPRPELHFRMAGEDVKYVAHQGEEMLAVNHSIAAYKIAAEHKCDYLKLDVRDTRDNVIVTQHDATLDHVYRVKGVEIAKTDYAELLKYKRSSGEFPDQHVCTLDEALEVAKTMPGVWIDFKHFKRSFADRVFARVAAVGIPDERVIVGTWSKPALRYVREKHPAAMAVAHTYIRAKDGRFITNSGDMQSYDSLEALADGIIARCRADGIQGVNVPSGGDRHTTPPWMVKKFKDAGLFVSIWFVKTPRVGRFYRATAADAFVTMCAEWTGRDVPYARPLIGVCAWCEDAADVAAAIAAKVEMIGFEHSKALDLDRVFAAKPGEKTWVYCDFATDVQAALAASRKLAASPRRFQTIVAGTYPVMKAIRADGLCNITLGNSSRRRNYLAPADDKSDSGYVDQTGGIGNRFLSVGVNFTDYGIERAHLSSERTICFGANDAAEVKGLHDRGFDFVVLPVAKVAGN